MERSHSSSLGGPGDGCLLQPKQRQRCFVWLRGADGTTPHSADVLHGAAWAEVITLTQWRNPSRAVGWSSAPSSGQWHLAHHYSSKTLCSSRAVTAPRSNIPYPFSSAQCVTGAEQRGTVPLVWPHFQIPFPHGRATAPLST